MPLILHYFRRPFISNILKSTKQVLTFILLDDNSDIVDKLTPIERKKKTDLHKIKGVCSICKELPYCWGACRADAFSKYHDINAPDPFCQSLYELGLFPSDEIETRLTYREIN